MRTPALLILAGALLAPAPVAQQVLDTFEGEQWNGIHGSSVAFLGDYNGDGVEDVIAGSPGYDSAAVDAGRVRVISGASGGSLVTFTGNVAGIELGYAVAGGGDFDNDGFLDLAFSAPGESRVQAYTGPGTDFLTSLVGAAGDRLGHSLAVIGDTDHDGFDELAVGSPLAGTGLFPERGRVTIWEPGQSGVRHVIHGNQSFEHLGWSVGDAGDYNGDGDPDVIIGAPGWDRSLALPPFVVSDVGRAVVADVSSPFSVSYPWSKDGGFAAGAEFGFSVDGAGDTDGDGDADLIVGAPFPDGHAFLYLNGETNPVSFSHAHDTEEYGRCVAGVGDVTGDGFDDFAIGGPMYTPGWPGPFVVLDAGRVEIRSGFGLFTFQTLQGGLTAGMGWSIDGGGDMNGDPFVDLVTGAPFDDSVINNGGRVVLWTAKPTGASRAGYGSGLAGTSGIPALLLLDDPVINTSTTLEIYSSTPAPATAYLVLGLQPAHLPFKGGQFFVQPPFNFVAFGLTGFLPLPYDTPTDPLFDCVSIYWQLVVLDPGAPQGFALSPGLRMTYGL